MGDGARVLSRRERLPFFFLPITEFFPTQLTSTKNKSLCNQFSNSWLIIISHPPSNESVDCLFHSWRQRFIDELPNYTSCPATPPHRQLCWTFEYCQKLTLVKVLADDANLCLLCLPFGFDVTVLLCDSCPSCQGVEKEMSCLGGRFLCKLKLWRRNSATHWHILVNRRIKISSNFPLNPTICTQAIENSICHTIRPLSAFV